ncbi:MAG: glycoside hydrolase family 5 protein [candidate division WS1 bacterium]|jgi:hypothetical protein|nr:glycoside hydrolase family 5 protein [candidate division WS1 bacterium]
MRRLLVTALALAAISPTAGAQTLFHEDFEGAKPLDGWGGNAGEIIEVDGGHVLHIIQPAGDEPPESAIATLSLPAEELRGKRITLRGRVRAEGLSAKPNDWNGVKVMLVLEVGEGREYPQLDLLSGSFPWGESFRVIRAPEELTAATLVLGLELVSGEAWFDEIMITEGSGIWDQGQRQAERFKGHDVERLRGAMHGPNFVEEDFRALVEDFGANHIRWQLNWVPMKEAEDWAQDLEAYDAWLAEALEDCDKAVALAEELGVLLLVDLHTPPGGRADGGVCRMFQERPYQEKLLEAWDIIARRYAGRTAVWAYDLINEPVEGIVADGCMDWRALATAATDVIRAVDPGKPVLVEPSPWGGPDGFETLVPLDRERVIYGFHMYLPHRFTHQGVGDNPVGFSYPGEIDGRQWDKEALREAMGAAAEFQERFNVHIHVGEFSAIRWAPENSAYRYLRDVIELFEEHGWDWTYHAFREWSGWSVEHTTDPDNQARAETPTDRELLMREWFGRNERPFGR